MNPAGCSFCLAVGWFETPEILQGPVLWHMWLLILEGNKVSLRWKQEKKKSMFIFVYFSSFLFFPSFFLFTFLFLRQGITLQLWLSWNWQRCTCLCLLRSGSKACTNTTCPQAIFHTPKILSVTKNFSSIDFFFFCHELIFSVLSQRTKNYMFRSELSSTDWEQGTSPDVLIGARNFI